MTSATLKISYLPIEQVQRYANNSRVHPPEQLSQIEASMKEFGFVNPCLVDGKTGELIAGHGRLEVAGRLGLKKVPVIRLDHLSPAQAVALRIADNSIALRSEWDPEMLRIELEKIDFDYSPLGLDDIDLPDVGELPPEQAAPRAPRSKTTIFLSVKNEHAEKARRVVVAALNKAGIDHNL